MQYLTNDQKQQRLDFCRYMLQKLNEDPDYFYKIFWTDESSFSTAGTFNRKNRGSWENQMRRKRLVKPIKKSGRKTVSVWCGIFKNKIVGPIFYNYKLTGIAYLEAIIPDVENILLNTFTGDELDDMIWMQDGAPPPQCPTR